MLASSPVSWQIQRKQHLVDWSIMFDIERHRITIAEHFFRLFRDKTSSTQVLYQKWISLLEMYSTMPRFVSFDPRDPMLHRLVPNAIAMLIVPFQNTEAPFGLKQVSIFPLYMFRVNFTTHAECCKEGKEILQMYLQLSGIRRIGLFKVKDISLIKDLLQAIPELQC
ncbi:hypothetical protein JTE90_003911 [Oedothorax gibbosus]|uniref:Uncharacterized protein n=1 Tax=Oedothorax gibbosus TaxID=931172 RepID=A0AAV6TL79_9ARAC|nr:hypothetical protein JTE90_003911 [Oedothorax gibbosus]